MRLCLSFFGICSTILTLSDVVALPQLSGVTLFSHGEGGYPCIRVPSIIRTDKSLLAFAGSRCGSGDGCFPNAQVKELDHQDLIMKRSTDNGRTWSALQVVYTASCDDRDHGTPVFDSVRNRVVLVTRGINSLVWTLSSDDDGATWSTPFQVPLGQYSKARPSPGRGVQLRDSNPHAPGRLLFVSQLGSGKAVMKGNVVYFTDDGGSTWKTSSTTVPGAQEAQIAELSDGTLLMNARVGLEKSHNYGRQFSFSHDGGKTWGEATLRNDLSGNSCFGSTISVGWTGSSSQVLLYSHPASFTTRANGTVWMSANDGTSFQRIFQVSPLNHDFGFAYSCLSPTHTEGDAALAYETGADDCDGPSCRIIFTTFTVPKQSDGVAFV